VQVQCNYIAFNAVRSVRALASRGVTIDPARAFQRSPMRSNRPRDPALLRAAVIDEVRIERHATGRARCAGRRGAAPVVESFAGVAESSAGSPDAAGRAVRAGGGGAARRRRLVVEYAIEVGEFHNGGTWLARLAGDGRHRFLSHRPLALREAAGPPGARTRTADLHTHGG